MDIILDLEGEREVSGVSVSLLQDIKAWIFYPEKVEFSISHDGANFEKMGEVVTVNEFDRREGSFKKDYEVRFDKRATNFVKAKNIGMCPPWHAGYENKGKAWLFADEIVIR